MYYSGIHVVRRKGNLSHSAYLMMVFETLWYIMSSIADGRSMLISTHFRFRPKFGFVSETTGSVGYDGGFRRLGKVTGMVLSRPCGNSPAFVRNYH